MSNLVPECVFVGGKMGLQGSTRLTTKCSEAYMQNTSPKQERNTSSRMDFRRYTRGSSAGNTYHSEVRSGRMLDYYSEESSKNGYKGKP